MPQPMDYDEDERYGETAATNRILKWLAGAVSALIVILLAFTVSCTSNKMDRLLEKQDGLSGDVRDLRGDVKVVTTKLEAQEKQYDRDRDEANRRLSAIERRP